MAYSSSCALGFHIVICLLTTVHGTFYPETVYLSDKCGSAYYVWGDARIKLASTIFLPPNETCTLTLQSDTNTKLITRFRSYFMDPSYINERGDCDFESIQLYNFQGTPQLSGNKGYCDIPKPDSLFDLGPTGKFSFTTYQDSHVKAADVEILVTAVKVKQGSDCPAGYFDCYYNNYCVSNAVTCNGYDDCSNNRDETTACSLSPGVIAAIAVCLIFAFGCIAFAVFCAFKRRVIYRYENF